MARVNELGKTIGVNSAQALEQRRQAEGRTGYNPVACRQACVVGNLI